MPRHYFEICNIVPIQTLPSHCSLYYYLQISFNTIQPLQFKQHLQTSQRIKQLYITIKCHRKRLKWINLYLFQHYFQHFQIKLEENIFLSHFNKDETASLHSKFHAQKVQMYYIQPPMYQTKFCWWKTETQNWQNNVATSQENIKPLICSTPSIFMVCLLIKCKLATWIKHHFIGFTFMYSRTINHCIPLLYKFFLTIGSWI